MIQGLCRSLEHLFAHNFGSAQDSNLSRRPPSVSIHLSYIYGFKSFDRRNSLRYVHLYYSPSSNSVELAKKPPSQELWQKQ